MVVPNQANGEDESDFSYNSDTDVDNNTTENEQIGIYEPVCYKSPKKKLKKQEFTYCLICNSSTIYTTDRLQQWTEQAWDTFCSAAKRRKDEVFERLQSFISGEEPLPLHQLKKHKNCYSRYKNPKTVAQKERKRINEECMVQQQKASPSSVCLDTRSKVLNTKRSCMSCLICMNVNKWLYRSKKMEKTMRLTLIKSGDILVESARLRNDTRVLREIACFNEGGGGIIAKHVMVHHSCRSAYISKSNIKHALSDRGEENSYQKAFVEVAGEVQRRIIEGKEVIFTKHLVARMNDVLVSLNHEPSYQSSSLKFRLKRKFGNKIDFWHPKWRGESEIIYSNEIPKGKILHESVQAHYHDKMVQQISELKEAEVSGVDECQESTCDRPDELHYAFTTGIQIHKDIQLVPNLPWPPRPEDMTEDNIKLPNTLYNTLAWIIGGDQYKPTKQDNEINNFSFPNTRSTITIADTSSNIHWRDKRGPVKPDIHKKVIAIGQDIVHAASGGRTTTVKQVLLAKAIQQKTGSLSLVSLLNKHQNCINKSLLQEMDTANAELILAKSNVGYHIPQGMIPNVPPLFGWDNNDYKNRGHFSGARQVHDTTGYMTQPGISVNNMETQPTCSISQPRTRRKSVKSFNEQIDLCIINKPSEPPRFCNSVKQLTTLNPLIRESSEKTDFAWRLARMDFFLINCVEPQKQLIPGWKGFNATLRKLNPDIIPHNIGYCQSIHKPPDNHVIYTFLKRSVEMTDEIMDIHHGKGSCSVPVVVDMGIWAKAIQVIMTKSNDPHMKRIVLHQGPFHTAMRFLACPGFLFGSAGLRDIFVESGVLAEGSVDKVLEGKHWERGFYAHSLTAEAFSRLRFMAFVDQLQNSCYIDKLKPEIECLRQNMSSNALQTLFRSTNFNLILSMYKEYITSLGENGKFWSMYIDIIEILLRHVRASRTSDWLLSLHSEIEMLPWFFACGRTVYARYKPLYLLMMLNLTNTHKDAEVHLLNGSLFTIQKSRNNPFGRVPADQETEMGVNRDSKSHGGIADISMNPAATLKWEILSTQRAEFVRRCSSLTGEKTDKPFASDDSSVPRVKSDEEKVQEIINTIVKWNNPFTTEGPLCHISSGRQATQEVAHDMIHAKEKEKCALTKFVSETLEIHSPKLVGPFENTNQTQDQATQKNFYDPAKKLTLCNFASMIKPKKKTIKGKTIRLRNTRDLFHNMTIIAMERGLKIDEVLKFPLRALPYSLANDDGSIFQSLKSVLMHELEKLVEPENVKLPTNQIIIVDGMAMLQNVKLCNNATFADFASTVLNMITKLASTTSSTIHWVCDTYPSISIKKAEHESRIQTTEGSFATTIRNASQKVDKQLKKALRDGQFKESLTEFLIEEWRKQEYALLLGQHTVYATLGSKCYAFRVVEQHVTSTEIHELQYMMEEADQRIILHAHYSSRQTPQPDVVIIRSPDTDVMVLAIAACELGWISTECLFLTGVGAKTRYVNVTKIGKTLGKSVCEGIIGAHAFTGCDSTCAFKGKSKSCVLWLLQNNSTFCNAMASLGHSLPPSHDVFTSCEAATCILYSFNSRTKKLKPVTTHCVNTMRAIMFASGTSDPDKLPPCKDALRKKILRANYQTFINRHCIEMIQIPSPHGHGWIVEDNNITVDWMDSQPAPSVVLAMTCCGCKGGCDSNRCSCHKNKLQCTGICNCSENCINTSKQSKNDNLENEDDSESDFDSSDDSDVN